MEVNFVLNKNKQMVDIIDFTQEKILTAKILLERCLNVPAIDTDLKKEIEKWLKEN